jgi:hypothetical protein
VLVLVIVFALIAHVMSSRHLIKTDDRQIFSRAHCAIARSFSF